METTIGRYIDNSTGRIYTVKQYTKDIPFRPLSDAKQTLKEGSYEFKTACGLDVEPNSDDLSSFTLIQIDGVIHRIDDDD